MQVREGIGLATWTHGEGKPFVIPPHGPGFAISTVRGIVDRMGIDHYPLAIPAWRTVRYDARGAGASTGGMDASLDA